MVDIQEIFAPSVLRSNGNSFNSSVISEEWLRKLLGLSQEVLSIEIKIYRYYNILTVIKSLMNQIFNDEFNSSSELEIWCS